MKKTTLLKIVVFICLLFGLQNVFSQNNSNNLTRQVLYILGPNEIIFYNEYIINSSTEGYKFALITYNESKEEFSFIFNGKRVITTDAFGYYPFEPFLFSYLNTAEENGYSLCYKTDEETENYYVIIKGISDPGNPYETAELFSEDGFAYALGNRWYEKIGNKISRPYIGGTPNTSWNGKITQNGKYIYSYWSDDYNYDLNINGEIKGPYRGLNIGDITENGKYIYNYSEGWQKGYININGIIKGPYHEVYLGDITENEKYIYGYKENRKYYVNINGINKGPYDNNYIFNYNYHKRFQGNIGYITEDGKYMYVYETNNKCYININGITKGPYDRISGGNITENGKYIYDYSNNWKHYININGITKGPYEYSGIFEEAPFINNEGKYKYTYVKNGKTYQNINGDIYSIDNFVASNRAYNTNSYIELSSPNEEHSFFSELEYEYVAIDGKKVGKSPAISAWYDEKKNAFVWNAIEGKEIIIYEYKLN